MRTVQHLSRWTDCDKRASPVVKWSSPRGREGGEVMQKGTLDSRCVRSRSSYLPNGLPCLHHPLCSDGIRMTRGSVFLFIFSLISDLRSEDE
ncbi:hypothetical protein CDAR_36601 [Caerostris darwini]|uniref:Uncharacterized protein n=1 Tax=Caerostris darwini TaxID=1538125 RepID=A0AAV4UWF0_9ARAC|nr:hypothetical protein CDAR_36601 [Caerostris darwini]